MKIELNQNKVFFNNGSEKKEIHPFWLRERANGEEYLDKGTPVSYTHLTLPTKA